LARGEGVVDVQASTPASALALIRTLACAAVFGRLPVFDQAARKVCMRIKKRLFAQAASYRWF
jgi:hypothetical protein